jgi:hypothetical protein
MFSPFTALPSALLPCVAGVWADQLNATAQVTINGRAGGQATITGAGTSILLAVVGQSLAGKRPRIDSLTAKPGVQSCVLICTPPHRPGWQSTLAIDLLASLPGLEEQVRIDHGVLLMDGRSVFIAASETDDVLRIDDRGIRLLSQGDIEGLRSGGDPFDRPWWRKPIGG